VRAQLRVISGDRVVGRIFKSINAPQDRPWMWTITGGPLRWPCHRTASRRCCKRPKAALAEHWRKCIAGAR
jgi:hypothetical protein